VRILHQNKIIAGADSTPKQGYLCKCMKNILYYAN